MTNVRRREGERRCRRWIGAPCRGPPDLRRERGRGRRGCRSGPRNRRLKNGGGETTASRNAGRCGPECGANGRSGDSRWTNRGPSHSGEPALTPDGSNLVVESNASGSYVKIVLDDRGGHDPRDEAAGDDNDGSDDCVPMEEVEAAAAKSDGGGTKAEEKTAGQGKKKRRWGTGGLGEEEVT